jgi:aminoglycoside N3'-acetyltransferase
MKDMDKVRNPYGGAAYLSYLTGKDIIPSGIYVPDRQKQLLEEKGKIIEADFDLRELLIGHYKLNKLKKNLYVMNFGKPRNYSETKAGDKKARIMELRDIVSYDCNRLSEEARLAYEYKTN